MRDALAGRLTPEQRAELKAWQRAHRWHPNQLRHTFATRLAEDGANASEIMRLLGHASLTTSQNYIEVTAAQERAAVRANRTNRALGNLG